MPISPQDAADTYKAIGKQPWEVSLSEDPDGSIVVTPRTTEDRGAIETGVRHAAASAPRAIGSSLAMTAAGPLIKGAAAFGMGAGPIGGVVAGAVPAVIAGAAGGAAGDYLADKLGYKELLLGDQYQQARDQAQHPTASKVGDMVSNVAGFRAPGADLVKGLFKGAASPVMKTVLSEAEKEALKAAAVNAGVGGTMSAGQQLYQNGSIDPKEVLQAAAESAPFGNPRDFVGGVKRAFGPAPELKPAATPETAAAEGTPAPLPQNVVDYMGDMREKLRARRGVPTADELRLEQERLDAKAQMAKTAVEREAEIGRTANLSGDSANAHEADQAYAADQARLGYVRPAESAPTQSYRDVAAGEYAPPEVRQTRLLMAPSDIQRGGFGGTGGNPVSRPYVKPPTGRAGDFGLREPVTGRPAKPAPEAAPAPTTAPDEGYVAPVRRNRGPSPQSLRGPLNPGQPESTLLQDQLLKAGSPLIQEGPIAERKAPTPEVEAAEPVVEEKAEVVEPAAEPVPNAPLADEQIVGPTEEPTALYTPGAKITPRKRTIKAALQDAPTPEPAPVTAEAVKLAADPASGKKAAFIPAGSPEPPLPENVVTFQRKRGAKGKVVVNPTKVTQPEVTELQNAEQVPGKLLGLSQDTKPAEASDNFVVTDSGGQPAVMTEVVKPGADAIEQAKAAQQAAAPGSTQRVVPGEQVLAGREAGLAGKSASREKLIQALQDLTPAQAKESVASMDGPYNPHVLRLTKQFDLRESDGKVRSVADEIAYQTQKSNLESTKPAPATKPLTAERAQEYRDAFSGFKQAGSGMDRLYQILKMALKEGYVTTKDVADVQRMEQSRKFTTAEIARSIPIQGESAPKPELLADAGPATDHVAPLQDATKEYGAMKKDIERAQKKRDKAQEAVDNDDGESESRTEKREEKLQDATDELQQVTSELESHVEEVLNSDWMAQVRKSKQFEDLVRTIDDHDGSSQEDGHDSVKQLEALLQIQAKQGAPKGKIDKAIDFLEKGRIGKPGDVYDATAGIPIAGWNLAIDLGQMALRAGKSIAEAVEAVIAHLRQTHQGKFDEADARERLTGVFTAHQNRTPEQIEADFNKDQRGQPATAPESLVTQEKAGAGLEPGAGDKVNSLIRAAFDKSKTLGRRLADFATEQRVLSGEATSRLSAIPRDAGAIANSVRLKMQNANLSGTEPQFTPEEAPVAKAIKDFFAHTREVANEAGHGINEQPNYFSEIVNQDIAIKMQRASEATIAETTKRFVDYQAEIARARGQEFTDAQRLEARDDWHGYLNTLGSDHMNLEGDFGALSKRARQWHLPPEFQDPDAIRSLNRYATRYARQLAREKWIDTSPEAVAALKNNDQLEARHYVAGTLSAKGGSPLTAAGQRLANSAVIQTSSAIWQSIQKLNNYATVTHDLPLLWNATMKTIQNFEAQRAGAKRQGVVKDNHDYTQGADLDLPGRLGQNLDQASSFLRKNTLSGALENANRIQDYTVGQHLATEALNGNNPEFMQKFGEGTHKGLTPEQNRDRMAGNFVEFVQGSYGAKGLPAWMLKGTPQATLFRIQRYGWENMLRTYQYTIEPAKKGDFGPLLTYMLAGAVTAPVVNKLREVLGGLPENAKAALNGKQVTGADIWRGRKSGLPTAHEIDVATADPSTGKSQAIEYALNAMSLADLAGSYGFLGKAAGAASGAMRGHSSAVVGDPSLSISLNLLKTLGAAGEAIRNGEPAIPTIQEAVMRGILDNMQMTRGLGSKDDLATMNDQRDKGVFNYLSGRHDPTINKALMGMLVGNTFSDQAREISPTKEAAARGDRTALLQLTPQQRSALDNYKGGYESPKLEVPHQQFLRMTQGPEALDQYRARRQNFVRGVHGAPTQ